MKKIDDLLKAVRYQEEEEEIRPGKNGIKLPIMFGTGGEIPEMDIGDLFYDARSGDYHIHIGGRTNGKSHINAMYKAQYEYNLSMAKLLADTEKINMELKELELNDKETVTRKTFKI